MNIKKIHLQTILILFTVMFVPASYSGASFDNDASHSICKYGEDNTSPDQELVHCEKCTYFFDNNELALLDEATLSSNTLITGSDSLSVLFYSNQKQLLYSARSPPLA